MSFIASIRAMETASSMRRGSRATRMAVRFIPHIPDILEDGTLYISMDYATAIHRCACGCGSEIVTPLSPIDWKLQFDGVSVTLDPSIGNWSYRCQSHYLIIENQVIWSDRWSKSRIEENRRAYRELATQSYRGEISRNRWPSSARSFSLRRLLGALRPRGKSRR